MKIIEHVKALNAEFLSGLKKATHPKNVLMCPPDFFKVIDVKNAHMEDQLGKIDMEKAHVQWRQLKEAFETSGAEAYVLKAGDNREDMVFTANPAFVGTDKNGQKMAVLSHMRHPSRQKEVPYFKNWFESQGYAIHELKTQGMFEGHGDGIWHPGRKLIWGGYGFRTQKDVYQELSQIFDCPVIPLRLENGHFYHLDTCFCPLDENTVMYYPEAFDEEGLKCIRALFSQTIELNEKDAKDGFAANAWVNGTKVFIQSGCDQAVKDLQALNYDVVEVDTSEFMKSGGSVFCLKLEVF